MFETLKMYRAESVVATQQMLRVWNMEVGLRAAFDSLGSCLSNRGLTTLSLLLSL